MSPLAVFCIVGAATFAIRSCAVVAIGRGLEVPDRVARTLRLVGPAVLSAIAANALLIDDGEFGTTWPWIVAAALAAGAWLRWRSGNIAFVVGFAAVTLLNQVL